MFSRLYRRLFHRTVEEVVYDVLRVGAFFTFASIPTVHYLNTHILQRMITNVDPYNTEPLAQKLQKHMNSMRPEYERLRIDYMNNNVAVKSFVVGGVFGLCGGYSILILLSGALSFLTAYRQLLMLAIQIKADVNTYEYKDSTTQTDSNKKK